MKRRMVNGDEVNAFSKWRHDYFWKPGERKAIKRRVSRRERREAKTDIKQQEQP